MSFAAVNFAAKVLETSTCSAHSSLFDIRSYSDRCMTPPNHDFNFDIIGSKINAFNSSH